MSLDNPNEQLVKVFIALCDEVATPIAVKAKQFAISKRWADIAVMAISPRDYTTSKAYAQDNAIVCFFKKLKMNAGVDTAKAALELFYKSERMCAYTNTDFHRYLNNGFIEPHEARILSLLDKGRDWLKDVLGPLPRRLVGRFGPGGTFDDRGRLTTVPDKMSSVATITEEAVDFIQPYWTETAWFRSSFSHTWRSSMKVVRGNRFTTVPKTAIVDRGICIEPSFNVYLQLAVGDVITSRLRLNAGIDKMRAQEIHKDLAQWGSCDGRLATMDLSSASDTVSFNLVKYLLPPDWFQLLSSLRSSFTRVKDRWVKLEKFSSMGNGYTFELETLIFLSLCHAAGCGKSGTDFFVYGDDIIVPTDKASVVAGLLRFCGFELNEKKTFLDGPFRESCGGDYFKGDPVRGHYVKRVPSHPSDWISLANGLRRLCVDDDYQFRWHYAYKAWRQCLRCLPNRISNLRGPQSLGDLVIRSDTYHRRWRNSIGYVRVLRPRFKPLAWYHWAPSVQLAAILYGVGTPQGVIPRGVPDSYKIGWVAFS